MALPLEEMTRKKNAADFPGAKQQEEALAKAEAVKRLVDDKAEVKALRQGEDECKRVLLEREKENYTRILALKCFNGWLKVCDHSALILGKWLEGKLSKRYTVNPDNGFGVKAKCGIISIPPQNVGDFIERLAKVGIPLSFDGTDVLEFELGERVSQEDMVRMIHEDELLIERTNRLVMPHAKLPTTRAAVKVLMEYIHTQARNQKESTREVLMNDAERTVIEANKLIISVSRGYTDIEIGLGRLGELTEEMYEYATTMCDMGLVTAQQYKECVDLVYRVEAERAREVARLVRTKTDTKMKRKMTMKEKK